MLAYFINNYACCFTHEQMVSTNFTSNKSNKVEEKYQNPEDKIILNRH